MAHLSKRPEGVVKLNETAAWQQKRGRDVLDQMYAYFSYSDLAFVARDEPTGYDSAA